MAEGSKAGRGMVIAAFATVYVVWGSTYLAILYAIRSIPPLLMAGARFLIAGAILYTVMRLRGRAERPTRRNWMAAGLAGVAMLGMGNGGVTWAEQRIPSGVAALLVASMPLWMVIIEWARGRRPSLGTLAGVAVGTAGLALLVNPVAAIRGGSIDLLGVGVVLVGSFCWAAGSLYTRGAPLPKNVFLASAMEMLAAGTALVLVGLLGGEGARLDLARVDAGAIAALAYLSVFGSIVAFSAFAWLLGRCPPARVATYAYVNPVVAVLLGWAFADEPLSVRTFAAMAVIVAGVVIVNTARAKTPVAASTPQQPESKTPTRAAA